MERLLIEWGKLERTEAIESAVNEKAEKILRFFPNATNLIVSFNIVNPGTSAGVATQKIDMELRLPNHQDVRSSKEGDDLYKLIAEAEKAIVAQKK